MTPLDLRLLTRFWHLVGHRRDLAETGDYVRIDWGIGEVVLFNDNGSILAFDNICPHRGARFFTDDVGRGRVICPYHGLSYRGGELRVPQTKSIGESGSDRLNLNFYRTSWCGDFLFVAVNPEESLSEQLLGSFEILKSISHRIVIGYDDYRFEFKSNWRVAVENALEGDHVNFVHPHTLAPLTLVDDQTVQIGRNIIYTAQVGDSRRDKSLRAMGRFFDDPDAYQGYWSAFVFPFAMISSTFGYSYALQNYWPSGQSDRSYFLTRMYKSKTKPRFEKAVEDFFSSSALVNRRIFDEDHAICSRVSKLFALDQPGRKFLETEGRIAALHETLLKQTKVIEAL